MPIYEYACNACGHELEALQSISDDPLKDCPECGRPDLRKRISAVAFRLKGSGWYETDFKSGNKRNLAGDDSKSGSASDGQGDKGKDKGEKSGKSSAEGSAKKAAGA